MTNRLTEKQTEQYMIMQLIEEDCIIDATKKIDYPPVALSFGEKLIKTTNRRFIITNSNWNIW